MRVQLRRSWGSPMACLAAGGPLGRCDRLTVFGVYRSRDTGKAEQ